MDIKLGYWANDTLCFFFLSFFSTWKNHEDKVLTGENFLWNIFILIRKTYSLKQEITLLVNYFNFSGKNDKDGILWMLIDGKGIELLTYIVIPALYIVIKIRLRSKVGFFLFWLLFLGVLLLLNCIFFLLEVKYPL